MSLNKPAAGDFESFEGGNLKTPDQMELDGLLNEIKEAGGKELWIEKKADELIEAGGLAGFQKIIDFKIIFGNRIKAAYDKSPIEAKKVIDSIMVEVLQLQKNRKILNEH